jgi:hypothetical protein
MTKIVAFDDRDRRNCQLSIWWIFAFETFFLLLFDDCIPVRDSNV